MAKLRIRRCSGNTEAWMLVALDHDGTELDSYGSYVTSNSLSGLMHRGVSLIGHTSEPIEFIPGAPPWK